MENTSPEPTDPAQATKRRQATARPDNDGTGANDQPARRAARTAEPARPSRTSRQLLIGIAIVCLIAGFGGGALISRRRTYIREHRVLISLTLDGNTTNITGDQYLHQMERIASTQAMSQLISEETGVLFATAQGVPVTEQQVDTVYKQDSADPDFAKSQSTRGLTTEEYRHNLKVDLARTNVITKGLTATDADAKRYYESNIDPKNPKARFYSPEATQLAVIVTTTEEEGKKALLALSTLPFATVVSQYGIDMLGNKGQDGRLPALQRGRTAFSNVPKIEEAMFKLKINDQIGPEKFTLPVKDSKGNVKSSENWWIIRCLDKREARTIPFANVAERSRMGALMENVTPSVLKQVDVMFGAFQKKLKSQAFEPRFEPLLPGK